MAEDFDPSVLAESPAEIQEFLRDAVTMEAAGEPELGDVDVAPGEVVGIVDGVEIRHLPDESDHVLSIEDMNGELIGKDSFPEVADLPPDGQAG